jgi:hypothetical protein
VPDSVSLDAMRFLRGEAEDASASRGSCCQIPRRCSE